MQVQANERHFMVREDTGVLAYIIHRILAHTGVFQHNDTTFEGQLTGKGQRDYAVL